MRPAFKPQVNVNMGEIELFEVEVEGDEMINKFLSWE
jgi:hypothetical protein